MEAAGESDERRTHRRLKIRGTDLPDSVPSLSVCNVYPISSVGELRPGELVMILIDGEFRPRRFLRKDRDLAWICGDGIHDLELKAYSGDFFRIASIYKNNELVKVRKLSRLVLWTNWLRSHA